MNGGEEKKKQVRPATMSKSTWKKNEREAKEKRKAERAAEHEKR